MFSKFNLDIVFQLILMSWHPSKLTVQPYGSDHFRSLKATRKRLDYEIPGPLYIHHWLKPVSDRIDVFSRNWRPRDYIEGLWWNASCLFSVSS